MLVDSHCHIHEHDFPLLADEVIRNALEAGVTKMLCVGTGEQSSRDAVTFAESHPETYAIIGVHPHDSKDGYEAIARLASASSRIVGVGEIGLDYFYMHSDRETQIKALETQIEVALKHDLPISFHVRDAFEDFWKVFGKYTGIRGVLHSFTDSAENLEKALAEGLYIGVNGISTFTKDAAQQSLFDSIPLDRLLLETDAPFLTPSPLRGKVNEPAYVRLIAEHHARRRNISLEEIAKATTENAHAVFAIS